METLGEACGFYKVGPRLFYREGPQIVGWLKDSGKRVFLDLKIHDIPSVVESATEAALELGATFFSAHVADGSAAAAARAVEGAGPGSGRGFFVLGVTVLTSSDASAVEAECPGATLHELLVSRARRAVEAGCDGIVAGVPDLAIIGGLLPEGTIKVCPGIRIPKPGAYASAGDHSGAADDQSRTATPQEAAEAGADFVVVGRSVLESTDPAGSFSLIVEGFLDQSAPGRRR